MLRAKDKERGKAGKRAESLKSGNGVMLCCGVGAYVQPRCRVKGSCETIFFTALRHSVLRRLTNAKLSVDLIA